MKLMNSTAEVAVPDGASKPEALIRTTHLGIGAHQDDLEFMALHGILTCFQQADKWFGGVVCTNGAGSARTGPYADCTNDEMIAVRRAEQNAAAMVGRYGSMIQLDYPSGEVKDPANPGLRQDLKTILETTQPDVVYTHNPADKHETHIGVLAATLSALRALPPEMRPARVLGCEVWRDLDWMPDDAKVALDVSGHENLASALNGVFDSQIAGGKRYDLAVMGRRRANATFFESHGVDASDQLWYAMDLTPLVNDEALDPAAYVQGLIDRFAQDVRNKLDRFFPVHTKDGPSWK